MPETTTSPRPPQVTIAAWLVVGGSVAVVLAAFDQIAGLRSLETREAVQSALEQPPLSDMGLGVEGALGMLRILTMVSAACATAAALLGVQILRRSRPARLVLTVVALPLFLAGVALGGIVSSIVVGATLMLWLQPARDWLDGKATPRPQPRPDSRFGQQPGQRPEQRREHGLEQGLDEERSGPRTVTDFGAPAPHGPRSAPTRPAALVWACVLTWVGSLIATLLMIASLTVVLIAPDILDQVYAQNPQLEADSVPVGVIRTTLAVLTVVVAAWSAAASVFAWFTLRGRAWAWLALLVSATGASAVCLALVLGSPLMVLPMLVCAVTVPLLLRPEVRVAVGRDRQPS